MVVPILSAPRDGQAKVSGSAPLAGAVPRTSSEGTAGLAGATRSRIAGRRAPRLRPGSFVSSAVASAVVTNTSPRHHPQTVNQPRVGVRHVRQRRGGADRRRSRAIGPRIAPYRNQIGVARSRSMACFADATPKPTTHKSNAAITTRSMRRPLRPHRGDFAHWHAGSAHVDGNSFPHLLARSRIMADADEHRPLVSARRTSGSRDSPDAFGRRLAGGYGTCPRQIRHRCGRSIASVAWRSPSASLFDRRAAG